MHVASTILFEGSPPTHDEFRDHIESRLHLVPRFRQKLRFVPFGQGRPVWVDDPYLNLDYHVRRTALPAPGSEEQLRNLASRIFSQQLDRSKPLWELWLVEGFEGDRFAIVGKSHHALVDGISGVDITTVLFDVEEEPSAPPVRPPKWAPRPEPTDLELLADALRERATSPREIVRGIRAAVRAPQRVLRGVGRRRQAGRGGDVGAADALQRRDRPPPPPRLRPRRPRRPEAGQERARRHGQRRRPLGRHRRARQLPARPRPRHRGARAARDGAGQRPRRGRARRARQQDQRDDGPAARSGARTRRAAAAGQRDRWAT